MFKLSSSAVEDSLKGPFTIAFELVLRVTVNDDELTQEFMVTNHGSEVLNFTTALHTYFKVPDASLARVIGLQGSSYLDSIDGRVEKVDESSSVSFPGEVDRIYVGVPRVLQIHDGAGHQVSVTTNPTFGDAVVWNPWVDKARRMADFGDDEYTGMVCVEVAQCRPPVALAPSSTWTASQVLKAA